MRSPRSWTRLTFPPDSTSRDCTTGIQYSRKRAPMGVPGPTLVKRSFSSRLSIALYLPLGGRSLEGSMLLAAEASLGRPGRLKQRHVLLDRVLGRDGTKHNLVHGAPPLGEGGRNVLGRLRRDRRLHRLDAHALEVARIGRDRRVARPFLSQSLDGRRAESETDIGVEGGRRAACRLGARAHPVGREARVLGG